MTVSVTSFVRSSRFAAAGIAILLAIYVTSQFAGVSAAPGTTVFISEVHPSGSGNGTYAADWFEVTNSGSSAVTITGWKMDDNSNASGSAVALRGVASIPAGASAIFLEGTLDGSTDAAIDAAFSNAWFGSPTIPAGVLIGNYGGSGVGLGTGGDAVNLFDGGGNRISGVSFGAATATATFDNSVGFGGTTLPLPVISTLSVVNVNGAVKSFNGAETGSPGRMATPPALSTVDLSLYVRVGRFNLPEPTRTAAPPNNRLAEEASGVTYNRDTDTLFIVGDGGTAVAQVSKTGQLIDTMTLAPGSSPQGTDFYDPEGIAYIGGGKFVMSEERDRQVVLFTYAPGTTLVRSATQTVKLGTFVENIGIEGLSYDPSTNGFIAVKETQPEGIFQTGIDFNAGTATNGSPTTVNSINLFDPALAGLSDFADVFALSNLAGLTGPESTHLLVLSQEAGRIVNLDRNGNISSGLTIASDPGNPLSVPDQQHEGMTMDSNGILYVVNENGGGDTDHPQLWVYAPSTVPNQAPTSISLTNPVTTIPENTSTIARIKVAGITITDDGLGNNNLSVTGIDAGFFEVDLNGLYIKAGTVLDFETKSNYQITVQVDDPSVGGAPDAIANYTLTVTDVPDENPIVSTLIVSEVAPWASGNTLYAADWFEVTNTGAAAVDMTGWRMDDSSNAFGTSVALTGIGSIAAGESVIFMETATPAATRAAFLTSWFGASEPAGLRIGSYSGGGVGLSTSGDAVYLFDAASHQMTGVTFGTSTTGFSFDNASALSTVTALSIAGVNGAFVATDGTATGSPGTTVAHVIVSEVSPWSSGDAPYHADWFEVTNVGALPVDLAGWKMDDNSNAPGNAVALRGVTRIPAGRSAVFFEGLADGSTDATIVANFSLAWGGSATLPAGFLIGAYGGSGVGLSTSGDAVNLFDGAGHRLAGVAFPGSTLDFTFDNAAGMNSTTLPLPVISTLSAVGAGGAFLAADALETGSPGSIGIGVTDDDGDGFTNPQEIASAGSQAGNAVGSNPLNPLSTPEACDGVDNDLNEGVDEGYADSDHDGVTDCVDADDDDDGIADAVDTAPSNAANQAFSDIPAPLNGHTAGTILTRAGRAVTVVDATPNPGTGVQMVVGAGGTDPVQVQLDGKATTIFMADGTYVLTDPGATSTVTVVSGGPAEVHTVLNGLPVVLVIGGGGSATYTETLSPGGSLPGFSIDAVTGNVTMNGKALAAPVTLAGPPQTADACKKNGWEVFNFPAAFKNQGDCVSYVVTAGRNQPAGR